MSISEIRERLQDIRSYVLAGDNPIEAIDELLEFIEQEEARA